MKIKHFRYDLAEIAGHFRIRGRIVSGKWLALGHINDTLIVKCRDRGQTFRYVVQCINKNVFKDPEGMMSNIRIWHDYMESRRSGGAGVQERIRVPEFTPAHDGRLWHKDRDGNYWRLYEFLEGVTYESSATQEQSWHAARAFGLFQRQLAGLSTAKLIETIPDFHNTAARFRQFESALDHDRVNRAGAVKAEIRFALKRRPMGEVFPPLIRKKRLPMRVVHNDAKLSNVVFDSETGRPNGIIDLDTVMPGLVSYDFGDLVRSMTCPCPEDERRLSKVRMRMPMFRAIAEGYLSSAGTFLTPLERDLLVFGGKIITFEIGLRFLTDYLSGDSYFRIHRPEQNLDRCRCQFKLLESIEKQEKAMERVVKGAGRS